MTGESLGRLPTDWVVALPMYDFPELAPAHDCFWGGLRKHLIEAGIADVPERLTRGTHPDAIWQHPSLLLAQACEYPLAKLFAGRVRLVASPRYEVPGCEGARYSSAIVVRR